MNAIKKLGLGLGWLVSTAACASVGAWFTFLALAWLGFATHGTYEVTWPLWMWIVPIGACAALPSLGAALVWRDLRKHGRLGTAPA